MGLLSRSRWLKNFFKHPVTVRRAPLNTRLQFDDLETRINPRVTSIEFPTPITPTEGAPLDTTPVQIAQFRVDNYLGTDDSFMYSAEISWGDGTLTAGLGGPTIQILGEDGVGSGRAIYRVFSNHTYADASPIGNPYSLTVTINDDSGPGVSHSQSTTVAVADQALTQQGPNIALSATVGAPLTNVEVAIFADANPLSTVDDYSATITWANPSRTEVGTVIRDASGFYHVVGSHTYDASAPPTSAIQVQIISVTQSVTINASATVNQAAIVPNAATVTIVEGATTIAAGTPIGGFTDTGGGQPAANYTVTAVIGGVLTGVTPTRVGTTNTYTLATTAPTVIPAAQAGTSNYTLTISPMNGAITTTNGALVVTNAALTALPGATPAPIEGEPLSNIVVATFTDANTFSTAAQFSASIDWGDGSVLSVGTVVQTGAGQFSVNGSHTYVDETVLPTQYRITVRVTDLAGGSATAATALFSVADNVLTNPVGIPVNGTADVQLTDVPVLFFTDENPFARVSDFAVTINWGDGSPPDINGTVRVVGGNQSTARFAVYGTHTYAAASAPTFPITVTVVDQGGTTINNAPTTATIVAAPLSAAANPRAAAEGIAIPAGSTVGTIHAPGAASAAALSATFVWGDGSAPIFTGAGLTIAPLGGGNYSVTTTVPHTYATAGTYVLGLSVAEAGGATVQSTNLAVVANGTVTAFNGVQYSVQEGLFFSWDDADPIITFTDTNPTATTGQFTATIHWGDGTTNIGTITQPGGLNTPFNVLGSHTYHKFGVYQIIVEVEEDGGAKDTATSSFNATLAVHTGSALTINAVQNQPLINVEVATFTSPNPFDTADRFYATIQWGDGTPNTAGIVVQDGTASPPTFHVIGSHTYTAAGAPARTITIAKGDPTIILVLGSGGVGGGGVVNVAASPLSSTGVDVNGTEGVALPNTQTIGGGTILATILATFTDNGLTDPSAYTASVNYGNGQVEAGTIVQNGGTFFVLVGTTPAIIYEDVGNFTFRVTITKTVGGFQSFAFGTAHIANAALTPANGGTFNITEGQVSFNFAPLMTFTDEDTTSVATDFTVSINWGDGTPATGGSVTPTGPDSFAVSGTHTYTKNGTYTVTVTVTDDFGQSISGTATVIAAQAVMTPNAVEIDIDAVQNSPLIDVEVASFTSGNGFDVASQFVATIAWGDGTTTPGQVVQDAGGTFHVLGTHTYATPSAPGTPYAVQVEVAEGDPVIVIPMYQSALVTVAASPLTVTTVTVNGIEGVALPDAGDAINGTVVATFTDGGAAAPLASYSATIAFGGVVGSRTGVILQSGSNFTVLLPAAPDVVFPDVGSSSFVVTVTKAFGAFTGFGVGTANIANATLMPINNAIPFTVVEGQPLSSTAFISFTDQDTTSVPGDFTVSIDWGDGTPASVVTPTGTPADYDVGGTHTYTKNGTYAVTVTITDDAGQTIVATASVNATQATITAGPQTSITGLQNSPLVDVEVTTFTSANGFDVASQFVATITWGDGTQSTGRVTQGANGVFHVLGTHTYASAGGFSYSVEVAEGDPVIVLPNFAAGQATISATPLIVLPAQVNGIEGLQLPNGQNATTGTVVATFLDLGIAGSALDYTAQIIWPAGTGIPSPMAGTVLQDGPNFVVVIPPNPDAVTFPNVGEYSFRVTVTKDTGAGSFVAFGIGTAHIGNAALTAVASSPVNAFQQTPLLNVEVGRFMDANPGAQLSEYSAMIDWGDGTPMSAASFLQPGGAGTVVIVRGNHTYANPTTGGNPYPITVFLEDDDGGKLRLDNIATVAASVLTGTPVTINGVENQTFANVVVAYFADSATPGPVSSYSASINWGDGSPVSIGQIVLLGGNNFAVLGTKNYAAAGNYSVTVTITRNGLPGVTVVSQAVIADAPISGTAVPFFAVEGANFTGTVGFFTSANPTDLAADFSALITWGDGTTSTGTVVVNGTGFRVTAVDPGSGNGKRYQDEGQYTFSVRVTSIDGAAFTAYEVATVFDAPLAATGITTTIPEWPAFNGIIATYSDANPFALATTPEHVATINWGDGVTSTGTIAQLFSAFPAPTQFTVSGTHLYEPGVYQVTIVIVDEGGSRTQTLSTITVTDSPLTAGPPITITSQEGQPFTAQVATFTDANPLGQIGEFTATINWGDGTPVSSAIIGQTAAGVFTVTGTHAYAAFTVAPLPVLVNIRSIDGATAAVTSSAIVTNAPLTSEGANINGVEGNSTGNVIVATFQDANPNSNIAHFTTGGGVITVSWGDGTPDTTVTAANVTSLGGANGVTYTIRAAHTYLRKGNYQLTTTIRDNGGATTVANGVANIANGTLARAGVQPTIFGTEGQTFSGVVFSFTDTNPLALTSDYTAEVNWGDGNIDPGVIAQTGPGAFTVSATHFFDDSGTYTIGVTVTDIDGATIGYTAQYIVANVAPTAVISNNGPVNENSPVTVTLSDPKDPSPVDVHAGFRYSFALTAGGLATSYLGASPNNSSQFVLPDGLVPPVGTTIFGRIFDKDGGSTDYTTSVTVLNVAPTATFTVSTPLIPGQPSTVAFSNQFDPSPVDTLAGFMYSYDLGTGVFGPLTTSPTAVFIPPGPGTYVIRGRIFDKDGSFSNGSFTEYVANAPNGLTVVPNVDVFALGAGDDGGPIVHVHSADTYARIYSFPAYEPTFRGGVLVAVGDVTGDGIPDVITGTGDGGGPVVKIFSGPLFAETASFLAYEGSFRGGVLVATADVDGDGRDELVTGTGIGGGPVVKVFRFNGTTVTQTASFAAYDISARGGVFVAGGNSVGAPRTAAGLAVEEIITGAGNGGAPHVKVFTGAGTELSGFFAYDPTVLGGVTVSAGDLYGTGFDNIVTGTGVGGDAHLKIWGSTGLPLFKSEFVFGPDKITGEPLRNGFNVSAKHIGGPNGRPIIIAGAGRDYGPTVRVFDAVTLAPIVEILPFEKEFMGGVYVG